MAFFVRHLLMTPRQKLLEEFTEESRLQALHERKAADHSHRLRVLQAKIDLGLQSLEAEYKRDTLISHREAASEVKRSADTLRKAIHNKELKAVKQPGKRAWFISLEDWERFKRKKGW